MVEETTKIGYSLSAAAWSVISAKCFAVVLKPVLLENPNSILEVVPR